MMLDLVIDHNYIGVMNTTFTPAQGLLAQLPLLHITTSGPLVQVRLSRPAKRNAINDALAQQLHTAFINLPTEARAVVLSGEGQHFCAGLDLSELDERSTFDGVAHSRMWHATMDAIQFGRVPVVAVLHGAVVGGGLELASSAHIRVAEPSTFYGLPEGQRGLFVGGGGSVRVPRLVGVARMTDMMLTGRVYNAQDGERAGFAQYLVPAGQALAKAMELAEKIAQNAPTTNFALTHVLPRIADQTADHGLMTEALMAAIAQSAPEAKERVKAFLEGRANKVRKD
jgi:enoyl-CoA hydratase/carnithine racemase